MVYDLTHSYNPKKDICRSERSHVMAILCPNQQVVSADWLRIADPDGETEEVCLLLLNYGRRTYQT